METLEVISNKKRQGVKRVQWLRNVHDTPKNNLSSTAADTFGTPISNSVSKWIRSLRIFDFVAGDNPSQLFKLCPLFQLTRVTFDPALPYMLRMFLHMPALYVNMVVCKCPGMHSIPTPKNEDSGWSILSVEFITSAMLVGTLIS